jgi:hypothetical protein
MPTVHSAHYDVEYRNALDNRQNSYAAGWLVPTIFYNEYSISKSRKYNENQGSLFIFSLFRLDRKADLWCDVISKSWISCYRPPRTPLPMRMMSLFEHMALDSEN